MYNNHILNHWQKIPYMLYPRHMHPSDVQTFSNLPLHTTHLKAPFVVCPKTLPCIKYLWFQGQSHISRCYNYILQMWWRFTDTTAKLLHLFHVSDISNWILLFNFIATHRSYCLCNTRSCKTCFCYMHTWTFQFLQSDIVFIHIPEQMLVQAGSENQLSSHAHFCDCVSRCWSKDGSTSDAQFADVNRLC